MVGHVKKNKGKLGKDEEMGTGTRGIGAHAKGLRDDDKG